MRAVAALMLCAASAVAVPLSAMPLPLPAGSPAPSGPIAPKPVSIVLLVDESGSLRDDGVAAEREAAAIIAQAEMSADSQVTVIGFGGGTGLPGQAAVATRCQPTRVETGQDRDYLSRC